MVAGLAVSAILAALVAGFLAAGYGVLAMLAAGFLAGSGLPILIVAIRLQTWRETSRAPAAPVDALLRRG